MSNIDDILSRLETLSRELAFIKADVSGLRQDMGVAKREYRDELVGLRSDLARFVSQFNAATNDHKKKLAESLNGISNLLSDSPGWKNR